MYYSSTLYLKFVLHIFIIPHGRKGTAPNVPKEMGHSPVDSALVTKEGKPCFGCTFMVEHSWKSRDAV